MIKRPLIVAAAMLLQGYAVAQTNWRQGSPVPDIEAQTRRTLGTFVCEHSATSAVLQRVSYDAWTIEPDATNIYVGVKLSFELVEPIVGQESNRWSGVGGVFTNTQLVVMWQLDPGASPSLMHSEHLAQLHMPLPAELRHRLTALARYYDSQGQRRIVERWPTLRSRRLELDKIHTDANTGKTELWYFCAENNRVDKRTRMRSGITILLWLNRKGRLVDSELPIWHWKGAH
jgi:hypothetical protein